MHGIYVQKLSVIIYIFKNMYLTLFMCTTL